ncbi:Fc receptor-like protein 5 [Thomomys bottae]
MQTPHLNSISLSLAAIPKSVISLHPPWTPVFYGERVNLTCKGLHSYKSEKTKWYHRPYRGKEKERETSGNTLEVHEAGAFRCQVQSSPVSDPVRLLFSAGSLILQAPHSVFEGDTLFLRCQKQGKEKLYYVKYKWNGKILYKSNKTLNLYIPRASLNNSGNYQCFGSVDKNHILKSNTKLIKIQELFPHPKLNATAFQPTEGSSVNLSCETHLHPERLDTPLHFIFFKDNGAILSGWNKSSELQIPTIWKEDSGLYGCGTKTVTHSVLKHSLLLQISVQRIPVSQVSLETQPPVGQAVEGETLVLICSAAEGTGYTTFSWHRENTEKSLGRKTERSQRAELEIGAIRESHAGGYYCTADNSYGPVRSEVITITVRESSHFVPVRMLQGLSCVFTSPRSPPNPASGDSPHSICPAQVQLQPLYGNVQYQEDDLVYSEIQIIWLRGEEEDQNLLFLRQRLLWHLFWVVLIFMLLWAILLVLGPVTVQSVSGQFKTALKSVISVNPPWTNHFAGQKVTLTCYKFGFYWTNNIKWYRGDKVVRNRSINKFEVYESGDYRCQADNLLPSKSVHLDFSKAELILQAPLEVFERDSVVLNCWASQYTDPDKITFYKDGTKLPHRDMKYHIGQAGLQHNGEYHCNKKYAEFSISSNSVKIQVKELFPRPVLLVSPPQPTDGSPVTLTCDTQLSPQKSKERLKFCFFKDDTDLSKSCSNSPELNIPAIRKEDSKSYTCQAGSKSGIWKISLPSEIPVQIPVSQPVLTIRTAKAMALEGDIATLHCESQSGSPPIWYRFYHGTVFLGSNTTYSTGGASFSFTLTTEHSGKYYCTARNLLGIKHSEAMSLSVIVPVSRPVLTLRTPGAQAVVGDLMELHCEALRGSPPIRYQFYHENVILGSSSAPSGGGASFKLSLTEEHSGNYLCEASNGQEPQRSVTIPLKVTVPVSHLGLTLRMPRAQAVLGDLVELHCKAGKGSPPIQYKFYHENVTLENSSAPFGGGASFNLFLTEEHSGNYSCEASNVVGAQQSEVVTIKVIVPVSRPVFTLRAPKAQVVVGDVVELVCEALRGSPPILYQFYYENITLGNQSAPSGGKAFFNFSVTEEYSGNYACEANNGLWAQQSDKVTIFVTGLTGDRSSSVAAGIPGALLSMAVLAGGALLYSRRLLGKADGMPASDPIRSHSDSEPQEPTYSNVPSRVELQPVYDNVNLGGDVVYSQVQHTKKSTTAVASEPTVPVNKVGLGSHSPNIHRFLHTEALEGPCATSCPVHHSSGP